jgi:GWxTD domain-containing protein
MPKKLIFSLFLITLMFLAGCSTSNLNVERGNSYSFRSGHPEIRLSAIGIITDDDVPLISTSTELIFNSLIYKNNENNERVAEVLYEIKVWNTETSALQTFSDTFDVVYNNNTEAVGLDSYHLERVFQVEPGQYEITVTVTDQNSLKDITLSTRTFIPDPLNPEINLTSILLLAKDNESLNQRYFPISTYDVPGKMDSLRFEFQATNNDSRDPIIISARLVRFESDTDPAIPMSIRNFNSASIQARGVDFRKEELIASSTRRLSQSGSVYIEFTYPQLERGNYRFEVTTTDNSGDEIQQARDFSIKSENYPAITSVKELATPLVYLMNDREYKRLMAIEDDAEMKQAIDRFWLENVSNPNIAREVIQKYYDRVEQANKLFSSFKEGWKTDMGKIYILFGHPWYVDETLRDMSWAYSYNASDFQTNFFFYQPRQPSKFFPFEHFLLRRNADYFSVEYRQKSIWLNGQILTENL